jgi:predicted ATPase
MSFFFCRFYLSNATLRCNIIYKSLSAGERRLLHGEVAEALRSIYVNHSEQVLPELAHHYTEAGWTEKAIFFLNKAGQAAAASYANDEAREYFSRALTLIPESDLETRWELLQQRVLINALDLHPDSLDNLKMVEELAIQSQDPSRQALASFQKAEFLVSADHDIPAASQAVEHGIKITQQGNDKALEALGYQNLGLVHVINGELEKPRIFLSEGLKYLSTNLR